MAGRNGRSNKRWKELTWHPPRRCFKKFCGGKTFYLKGDRSGRATVSNYKVSLREFRLSVELNALAASRQRLEADREATESLAALGQIGTILVLEAKKGLITGNVADSLAAATSLLNGPSDEEETASGPKHSIRSAADTWLSDFKQKVARAKLSASRYDKLRVYINHLVRFLGRDFDVAALAEADLLAYRTQTLGPASRSGKGDVSDYEARYRLQTCARFVRWLWQNRYLAELPRNIDTFKQVEVAEREVMAFSLGEVRSLWENCCTDRQRLLVCLGLNTGMNQSDISSLAIADCQDRYIIKRRQKTGVQGCWRLWDRTRALVEACRDASASQLTDCLFRTGNGRPLVEIGTRQDGKGYHNDSVRLIFARICKKAGVHGTFSLLRKTAASDCERLGFADVVKKFLAHKDGSVAARYYVTQAAKVEALKGDHRLREAVEALGKYYGLT